MKNNPVIIISRTDSIGDVVLTLPMAGVIKQKYPHSKILFLARNYTKDVVLLSQYVDSFISYDEILALQPLEQVEAFKQLNASHIIHVFPVKEIAWLAKKANIKNRVGTANRLWHWFTCNIKVALSRKKSNLHEAQLNIKLLSPLGISDLLSKEELASLYGFTKLPPINDVTRKYIPENRKAIILHPKSKGSAREWGLENFSKLINQIDKTRYAVFISGTKEEGELMRDFIQQNPEAIDLTGKLSLQQFIAFINAAHGLVAASTGPLHIASALGKLSIGLYAPMVPIHPQRWAPIGKKAHYLVLNKTCSDCRKNMDCHCIREIEASKIIHLLDCN